MGEAPFGNREDFFQYFQNTWLDGSFPIGMWNVYSMEGPRTNNNTEGWHSKLRNLAGKAHPNIYEAVTLFKSEQAATEGGEEGETSTSLVYYAAVTVNRSAQMLFSRRLASQISSWTW